MNNKSKWIILVLSICLCCSFVAIGALALREVSLNIGGTIDFKSTGVEATISNATITNTYDELPALESFIIKKRTTQDEIEQKMSAWANLPLAFNDNGTDIVISFDVKNNATNSDSYIEVDYEYTLTTAEGFTDNADIFPSSSNEYIIAPGKTNTIKLLVKVLNKKADVSISAMNLSIKLNYIEAVASSDWEFIADKPNVGEATLTKFVGTLPDDGVLSIPAVIKNGSNRYIASVIDSGINSQFSYISSGFGVPATTSQIVFANSLKSISGLFCSDLNYRIKTLDLPISLTEISNYCFQGSYIVSLDLPNGLKRIGEGVFYYSKLRVVNLPYLLEEIDYYAFTSSSLTTITCEDSTSSWLFSDVSGMNTVNPSYSPTISELTAYKLRNNVYNIVKVLGKQTIGDFSFAITSPGKNYLIGYSGTSAQVTLPTISNGYDIANNVFLNNTTMTRVTIPSCVKNIGAYAFYGCSSLMILSFSEGVESLGFQAFYGCKFTGVTLPSSLLNINAAFNGSSISSAEFSDQTSPWILSTSFGNVNFREEVYGGVFYNVSTTTASANASKLKSSQHFWIKVSDVTYNGDYVFASSNDKNYLISYTGSEKQITLPTLENNYEIAPWTFFQYTITSVSIPSCVTKIGVAGFYRCSTITSVTISEGLKNIEGYAFYNCTSLTAITIPSSVKSIGMQAFAGCSKLASVTLNEGLEEISNSFYNCSLLTTITIPSTVEFMTLNAFSGTGLTTAKFNKVSGWSVVAYNGAITQIEVTSDLTEANATLLKTTYKSYNWINS